MIVMKKEAIRDGCDLEGDEKMEDEGMEKGWDDYDGEGGDEVEEMVMSRR